MKYDAVIAGARCAGAATALLIARAGGRVLLVDKGRYGTDTLSTLALMRGGVLQLHRWGLLPAIVSARTPAIRSTTFGYTGRDVTVAIEPRYGVDALYAPRRTLLDSVLVNAAAVAGAEVRYGSQVDDVIVDPHGRVTGAVVRRRGRLERIEADLVVGADGRHSTVARLIGAGTLRDARYSTAVLYTYWEGLGADAYYWGYRPGASVGVVPTNDGVAVVFVAVPWDRFRDDMREPALVVYHRLIRGAFESLGNRLLGARRVEPVRGFGGQRGFLRQASGPGWALVGDAGYFKDPLTAHGITDALRDAEFLTRAALRGTADAFAEYERTRSELSDTLFAVTDEIASFTWTDERVETLHRMLSREMAREVRALAALDDQVGAGVAAAGAGAPASS